MQADDQADGVGQDSESEGLAVLHGFSIPGESESLIETDGKVNQIQ